MQHKYKIKVFGECNYAHVDGERVEVDWHEHEMYTGNGNYKSRESAEAGIRRKIKDAESLGSWRNLSGYVYEV